MEEEEAKSTSAGVSAVVEDKNDNDGKDNAGRKQRLSTMASRSAS